MKSSALYLIIVIILFVVASSCKTANQLRYFKDLPDTSVLSLPPIEQESRIIQRGDRMQITIAGRNEAASNIFNNYGGVPSSGGLSTGSAALGNSEVNGYLVDEEGKITFPIIGPVAVTGYTTKQLRDTLTTLVAPYLKEPLVNVRFFNFKFTVLGEVRSPGTYVLPQQRTTILDALGAAGDLPITAKRYDIALYRDYNGKRTISKIDLRKSELLNDPNLFQIRHNDIIYVQPRDIRLISEETRTYIGILSLLFTAAALIISIAK